MKELKCIVIKGSIKRNQKEYNEGDSLSINEDEARQLFEIGIVDCPEIEIEKQLKTVSSYSDEKIKKMIKTCDVKIEAIQEEKAFLEDILKNKSSSKKPEKKSSKKEE